MLRIALLAPLFATSYSTNTSSSETNNVIHIAVAADKKNIRIVRALLASAVVNSQGAFVHVIHAQDGKRACQDLVRPDFASVARCVLWKDESVAEVSSMIRVVSGQNTSACEGLEGCDLARAKRLANSFNFARFFLADILPEIDRVIWMDCDVVITQPIDSLWAQSQQSTALVAAFPEPERFGRFYLQEEHLSQLLHRQFAGIHVDMEADSFNDGVIFINLKRWRETFVRKDLTWLMNQHGSSEIGLWKYGTQPIMMLLGTVFGWSRLPATHCYGDLGFRVADPKRINEAVFLHFNGERKPWKKEGINRHLWEPYYDWPKPASEITL
jgi:lipopolysaccharide biosynthesis glycosyltransferase